MITPTLALILATALPAASTSAQSTTRPKWTDNVRALIRRAPQVEDAGSAEVSDEPADLEPPEPEVADGSTEGDHEAAHPHDDDPADLHEGDLEIESEDDWSPDAAGDDLPPAWYPDDEGDWFFTETEAPDEPRPARWGLRILAVLAAIGLLLGVGAWVLSLLTAESRTGDQTEQLEDLEHSFAHLSELHDELTKEHAAASAEIEGLRAELRRVSQIATEADLALEGLARLVEDLSAAAEHVDRAPSIPDGQWLVGRDFEPGTYVADSPDQCRWSVAGGTGRDVSGAASDGHPVTVTLAEGQAFTSSGCGIWTPAW